jgi:hypothetical protein
MSTKEDTELVKYKPIPNFPGYCVSNTGEVWSRRISSKGGMRNEWCRLVSGEAGPDYPRVCLHSETGAIKVTVHTLVLLAFVGPRPIGMEVCHNDGNPKNNELSNLRWDTHKANQQDMSRHGRTGKNKGSRNGNAKLSEEDVLEIHRMLSEGASRKDVAWYYGVCVATIGYIASRHVWSHIQRN